MSDKKKVILVVEDNPDDQLLITRALRKNHIDNEIVAAGDGEEALEYIYGTGMHAGRDARVLPEVVLLDLQLPKVNGLQVLQRLRAEEHTRLLPVVVLTSSDEQRDVVDSYRFGANSYIRKPVEFQEFMEAVRQLDMYWVLLNRSPT